MNASILEWLPFATSLHLLEIGCGTANETGLLLDSGRVAEFVGVDLDETAIVRARARWPQATFLCADAANLPAEYWGRFDAILIRRPDLFVQPERWRHVFATLPRLLRPEARVIVTLIGAAETSVAREWLETNGLRVIHDAEQPGSGEPRLIVAEISLPALIRLDDDAADGMYCDALTGECFRPSVEGVANDAQS